MQGAEIRNNPAAQIFQDFSEAMADFTVFCDKWVWIEDKERHCAIKLELWPAQREVLSSLVVAMLLIILKTRQVGLTWLCAALVLWLGLRNLLHLTVIISASEDHATEFLGRVYFILDRLPAWMIPTIKTRNNQTLTFATKASADPQSATLESTIKSLPTIEMGAESKTPNLLIIDEAHMIRNVGSIFSASLPGIEQAKGRVIIIPNSIKNAPGWGWIRDTYVASMRGINKFSRIFLPWQAHPGRPADFRQCMILSGMDEQDVKEHYPETEQEALESSTGSYFGDTLKRHNQTRPGVKGWLKKDKRTGEVEFNQDDKKGIVEIWRHPYFLVNTWDGVYYERYYAIGDDVSEGLGESSSVAYVRDRLRDENVCRVRSNRLDAVEWAEQMDLLSQYYCNHIPDSKKIASQVKSLICTEITGAGQTTVKELIKRKCIQYVRMVPDKVGSGLTKQYGWTESNQSKHELCGDLKAWFRTTKGTVYDAILLDECSTFIRFDNGKLDHEDGKRSDCVITAGLVEQASIFLGEGPKAIPVPITGWRKRLKDEAKKGEVWAA